MPVCGASKPLLKREVDLRRPPPRTSGHVAKLALALANEVPGIARSVLVYRLEAVCPVVDEVGELQPHGDGAFAFRSIPLVTKMDVLREQPDGTREVQGLRQPQESVGSHRPAAFGDNEDVVGAKLDRDLGKSR